MRPEREDAKITEATQRFWDVIVIGAGPAGALSALCAARTGASTLLVERKQFPRSKVCGGCLNVSALGLLDSIGLGRIASEFGQPVDHLELGLRGRRMRVYLPGGVAIPRTRLDSEIVRHAQQAGARFLPGTSARLANDDGSARHVMLRSERCAQVVRGRVVVVAAGLASGTLAAEPEFSTHVRQRSRIGAGCLVENYPRAFDRGCISMAIGRSGYVGITPTIDGLVIASATDVEFLKRPGGPARAAAEILEEAGFPPVPSMLSADWAGTLPLTQSTRPLASSRVFLVGDAAGYVEPFTGQGMAQALQGAVALSEVVSRAIRAWSPAIAKDWSNAYSRTVGSHQWPAALVAAIVRRPRLASFAFALAEAVPAAPTALVRIVNRPIPARISTVLGVNSRLGHVAREL